jgi:hypothetical protein
MDQKLRSAALLGAFLVAVLVVSAIWGSWSAEQGVERAVRRNFTAVEQLARLQVAGERMRRFEKEFFIYAGVADRRAAYAKDFDQANTQLLELLDIMLAPSGKAFDDEERAKIMSWKQATLFYQAEFAGIVRPASDLNLATLSSEQRIGLTLEYNERIKAGKDRFRELLAGAEGMRTAKEKQSQAIAGELASIFGRMQLAIGIPAALIVALVAGLLGRAYFAGREREARDPRDALAATPRRAV